jgi:hypothetical protein
MEEHGPPPRILPSAPEIARVLTVLIAKNVDGHNKKNEPRKESHYQCKNATA